MKMTEIVENLLDCLIASDTTNGVGCDNMTTILVKFKWWVYNKLSGNSFYKHVYSKFI